MKFSTKTTYGLRAMINLAGEGEKNIVSLSKIAKEEGISLKYLEKIFSQLKKADLVRAEVGVSGGYRLTKKSSQITVFDIVKALEGEIAPFHCLSADGEIKCNAKCHCKATVVLIKVQKAINKTLKDIKLSDLI